MARYMAELIAHEWAGAVIQKPPTKCQKSECVTDRPTVADAYRVAYTRLKMRFDLLLDARDLFWIFCKNRRVCISQVCACGILVMFEIECKPKKREKNSKIEIKRKC